MSYKEIQLARIKPSPMNPRKHFGGPKDEELVASVRSKGVLQPIVVRAKGDEYEIVAGERRWRAACRVADEDGGGGVDVAKIPSMVRVLTDEEAFDVMTVENLQREDLSEREEADGFKAYLARRGEEALPDLALRTGIDPRYIRRRVRVLSLPKELLQAWEKGKLSYGHLEQLLRVQDLAKDSRARFHAVAARTTVQDLKGFIDRLSVPLGKAQFKTTEAGCGKCPKNTAVQHDLFGTDAGKAKCTDPECFIEKTRAWLAENWEKSGFKKRFGTNGFLIRKSGENLRYESWWGEKKVKKDCRECKDLVTLLSADDPVNPYQEQACMNPACWRKTYKTGASSASSQPDRSARRAEEHGTIFRERYFQTRIPLAICRIDPGEDEVDRLALASLLYSNSPLHPWFIETMPRSVHGAWDSVEAKEPWFRLDPREIWTTVTQLPIQYVRQLLRDGSLEAVMQKGFGHDGRYAVARSLGADLQKEWQITAEYLEAKTKAEIVDLGDRLGITSDPKAAAFLYEKLGKKRGRFDTCKKSELIRVMLESGVELAGKVPAEILVTE